MDQNHEALYQAPYIVWVYYLSEGWTAYPQPSWKDAIEEVLSGRFRSPCVITSGAFMPTRP